MMKQWVGLLLVGLSVAPLLAARAPVDYANPLVGTASLDDPKLRGNAPPPGEEAYTGFTHPGPSLPHRTMPGFSSPVNQRKHTPTRLNS